MQEFLPKGDPKKMLKIPLEVVHTDFYGPMKTTSMG
jgi:hypothetical protein